MRENPIKRKLREGLPSAGTWLSLPSPYTAELAARAGFDWAVVDLEHNPISIETAGLMISAVYATETVPFVRIPWNTGENIKRALDIGAWGIVVPMVNSREEAEAAVRDAKYFPDGRRSVGGTRHAMGFNAEASEYFRRANEETMVVVQIEHIEAVRRIDDILSVPGIDACFIGPNDLMSSMGLAPSLVSALPEVQEAIRAVLEAAKRHGVPAGIHVPDAEEANRRIDEGFQWIAVSSDLGFLLGQARREAGRLRPAAVQAGTAREVRY